MKTILYGNKTRKNFFTQHNGGFIYYIIIDDKIIKIYSRSNYDNDTKNPNNYKKLIKQYKRWEKVFIGVDNAQELYGKNYKYKLNGNSLLIKLSKNKYAFVGRNIYEFTIDDEITSYYSPTGNSYVPYPYAIGTENTYLMLANVYIQNDLLTVDDPYEQYYNFNKKFKITHTGAYKIKVIDNQ